MAVNEVALSALEQRLPAQSFPSQTCAVTRFSSTWCHLDVKPGCGKKNLIVVDFLGGSVWI